MSKGFKISIGNAFQVELADQTATVFSTDPQLSLESFTINKEEVNMEVGDIILSGSDTPSANRLLADGSAVSRTGYADLFARFGTKFGAGDGSSTFNLPDMRGRIPAGAGTGAGLTARTIADTGGNEKTNSIPVYTGDSIAEQAPGTGKNLGPAIEIPQFGTGNTVGIYHSQAADSTISGASDEGNMQPYVVLNFFVVAVV